MSQNRVIIAPGIEGLSSLYVSYLIIFRLLHHFWMNQSALLDNGLIKEEVYPALIVLITEHDLQGSFGSFAVIS